MNRNSQARIQILSMKSQLMRMKMKMMKMMMMKRGARISSARQLSSIIVFSSLLLHFQIKHIKVISSSAEFWYLYLFLLIILPIFTQGGNRCLEHFVVFCKNFTLIWLL